MKICPAHLLKRNKILCCEIFSSEKNSSKFASADFQKFCQLVSKKVLKVPFFWLRENTELQYFCSIFVIMYCTVCCGGHFSLLLLFSTKELVDFWMFYFIVGCLVYSMIKLVSTSCILRISHVLTVCKPWWCYMSNCSNK